jgi:hypothetical protein
MLQKFGDAETLIALEVEGCVELIDQHHRGTGDRLAATHAVGYRAGRQRKSGGRRRTIDLAENRDRLPLSLARAVGMIQVALLRIAIVQREIILREPLDRSVLIANHRVHFDQPGAGAEDSRLLRKGSRKRRRKKCEK